LMVMILCVQKHSPTPTLVAPGDVTLSREETATTY
jgi:hypothetical protein